MRLTPIRTLALGIAVMLCHSAAACGSDRRSVAAQPSVAPPHLDSLIRRDLRSYFARDGRGVARVDYELLRMEPTVTGIAYPKYYAWVTTYDSLGAVSREGAARLALLESTVEITHFLPRAFLLREPAVIDSVFPATVGTEIRRRLGVGAPTT